MTLTGTECDRITCCMNEFQISNKPVCVALENFDDYRGKGGSVIRCPFFKESLDQYNGITQKEFKERRKKKK